MLLNNAHKPYDKVIHQIIRISVLVDRGKGWSTESGQACTSVGRGQKKPKTVNTSFKDKVIEFIILCYIFFSNFIVWYKEYFIWQNSFIEFSDILRAFTYACAIGNLSSFCLGVSVMNPLPFCCSLKSTIFSAISITLSWFCFQELPFY